MTAVAGLNVGRTRHGQPLQDGGCAILEDGRVLVAISEERINREKYSPGFYNSLEYCLKFLNKSADDIDYFVVSNCSDRPLTTDVLVEYFEEIPVTIPEDRLIINSSHHLSHAACAFYASPYEEALVLVADNNGNVLRGTYGNPKFNGLERTTAYTGRNTDIELLQRYHDGCSELGLGAVYKYVTLYLGFDSYKDAGKVMGLASYGDGELAEYQLFDDDGAALIESRPHNRNAAVRECFRDQGFDPGPRKENPGSPSDLQIEIAWLVQRELENALIKLVSDLVGMTSLSTLCYAGGVALNCVANQKIREETPLDNLFIPPAPGDYGQCLGNALYGWHEWLDHSRGEPLSHAYLGKYYDQQEIADAIAQYDDRIVSSTIPDVPSYVAERLVQGDIIAMFSDRAEFGPRALGNRSILADPRDPTMKDRINSNVKFREDYRPFAPTILRDHYEEYFASTWADPCRYMILAQPVLSDRREEIPAVTHVNGTARLQTVSETENERYYKVIEEFYRRTDVPVVLNTSFNLSGDPIVETPTDAIETFLRSGIDRLVVGDTSIEERRPVPADTGVVTRRRYH